MASFTKNAGGDLVSTTLEGAFLELLQIANSLPKRTDAPTTANLTLLINTDTSRFTGTFNFPCGFSLAASNGHLTVDPVEWLDTTSYTPGTPGGTLRGTGLTEQIVEVISIMESLDYADGVSAEIQSYAGVTINIDRENNNINGSFAMPIALLPSVNGVSATAATIL